MEAFVQHAIELRHLLHKNAELSMCEDKTRHIIYYELSKYFRMEIHDRGKWILCAYKSDNPVKEAIAFRADFDALPIPETITEEWASDDPMVSHRCGHDGHTAILLELAEYIELYHPDRDIFLIFQHAEEIGAGAKDCIEFLRQYNISRVYALHNWSGFPEGTVMIRKGTSQLASKGITFSFTGKESHASQPEDGNNPCIAISKLAVAINEILSKTEFSGLAFATIVNLSVGSKNFGINPGYGELSATIRAETEQDMNLLESQIKTYAEAYARDYSLILSCTENDVFPETANDDESVDKVISACEKAGVPCKLLDKPFRSSEDFGWFTKAFGGAIFYVGNGEDYPQIHTTEYDFNDNIINPAIKVFIKLLDE